MAHNESLIKAFDTCLQLWETLGLYQNLSRRITPGFPKRCFENFHEKLKAINIPPGIQDSILVSLSFPFATIPLSRQLEMLKIQTEETTGAALSMRYESHGNPKQLHTADIAPRLCLFIKLSGCQQQSPQEVGKCLTPNVQPLTLPDVLGLQVVQRVGMGHQDLIVLTEPIGTDRCALLYETGKKNEIILGCCSTKVPHISGAIPTAIRKFQGYSLSEQSPKPVLANA